MKMISLGDVKLIILNSVVFQLLFKPLCVHNYQARSFILLYSVETCRRLNVIKISLSTSYRAPDVQFSTWMPSMESQFQTIKVLEVEMKERGGVLAVEVLEEYRPKAQVDAK